jgi:hypothetical protein
MAAFLFLICSGPGLPLLPSASAHDFDQDTLDLDATGVKCPWRVILGFNRGKSDFDAPAGIGFQGAFNPVD